MFEITGKVALITGGASGIGLAIANALLENGLRAVAIIDIKEENCSAALEKIKNNYGEGRAIFIKADITDKNQFDDAFKFTIDALQNLDIVVNNAALGKGTNWEKIIETNLIGTTTGSILAIENYLPKFKTGSDAVILNISSLSAAQKANPVYNTTKSGILGLTRSLGTEVHYKRSKVRVIVICCDWTQTSALEFTDNTFFHNPQDIKNALIQDNALVRIIREGNNGSIWVVTNGQLPYEVEIIYSKPV